MSESKIEIAKAIEEGAEVREQSCICFACKHSMIFVVAKPVMKLSQLSRQMERKIEARDQAVCCRWASPMLIGTDVQIQACTEFEPGSVKSMKSPGGAEPSGIIQ